MVTRTALLVCGTLTIATAACGYTESAPMSPPSPTPYDVSVAPSSVVLVPASVDGLGTSSCLTFLATFDLIVRNFGASDLFLDAATFQLIDGTTLGGPTMPIPSQDLNKRFGHLLIHPGRTRAFRFHERFGCGVRTPRVLRVDARFVGSGGGGSYVTVEVPTR